MKRLVLLLMLGLGWAAYDRLARRSGTAAIGGDAYPFPTSESHAAIPAGDDDLTSWAEELGCSETDLRSAIGTVGRSVDAVRDHLARH